MAPMPHFEIGCGALFEGDCVEVLRAMPEASVDAVITDPPYAIAYDGNDWDRFGPTAFQNFCTEWGTEAARVLKPGGHLLAFGATRTYHRLKGWLHVPHRSDALGVHSTETDGIFMDPVPRALGVDTYRRDGNQDPVSPGTPT